MYGFDVLMMTEQQARRLGFDVVEHGAIVRNGSALTRHSATPWSGRSPATRRSPTGIATP